MAVATLYTGQPGFDVPALILALLKDESVPALKVLRHKEPGLRKRADWEHTWQQQRREDALDAEVAAAHPRKPDETEAARSEERRVGKGWVGTCRSGWSPYH